MFGGPCCEEGMLHTCTSASGIAEGRAVLRSGVEGRAVAQGTCITQELGRTALPGVWGRVLPRQAPILPAFRAGLACPGLGRPPAPRGDCSYLGSQNTLAPAPQPDGFFDNHFQQ